MNSVWTCVKTAGRHEAARGSRQLSDVLVLFIWQHEDGFHLRGSSSPVFGLLNVTETCSPPLRRRAALLHFKNSLTHSAIRGRKCFHLDSIHLLNLSLLACTSMLNSPEEVLFEPFQRKQRRVLLGAKNRNLFGTQMFAGIKQNLWCSNLSNVGTAAWKHRITGQDYWRKKKLPLFTEFWSSEIKSQKSGRTKIKIQRKRQNSGEKISILRKKSEFSYQKSEFWKLSEWVTFDTILAQVTKCLDTSGLRGSNCWKVL